MLVDHLAPSPLSGENAYALEFLQVLRCSLARCNACINKELDLAVRLREDELYQLLRIDLSRKLPPAALESLIEQVSYCEDSICRPGGCLCNAFELVEDPVLPSSLLRDLAQAVVVFRLDG